MDKAGRKIVLFTESLGSGGAERQLSGLAVLMKEKGYDVRLVYFADNHFYAPFLKRHGVDYEYVPSMKGKRLRPFRLASYLRGCSADLVISYLPFCNKTACLARLLYRFRLIVSERNTTQKLSLKDRLFFALYRLADVVVPNSYSQEGFIREHFPVLAPKLRVITNFVDTDYFSPSERSSERRILRILTVARVAPQKNCLRYLEAVKLLSERTDRPFVVDWYGNPGSVDYDLKVKAKVVELGLGDVVTFHQAAEDIRSEYRNADIFCLPSIYEGYPNTLCEAMSCGLPVACGRVCDNPRIVVEDDNGYMFNPLDAEDIADKLLAMVDMSPEERAAMGDRSRELAVCAFSQENFAYEYEKIIND